MPVCINCPYKETEEAGNIRCPWGGKGDLREKDVREMYYIYAFVF